MGFIGSEAGTLGLLLFVGELLLRLGLSLRILARRLPVGTTFAWLFIVLAVPWLGAVGYLMFGELRLGRRRARLWLALKGPFDAWLESLNRRFPGEAALADRGHQGFARLATQVFGIPPLPGNALELLPDAETAMRALIADIEAAQSSCHLEFYIWSDGGRADDVAEALVRAAQRGVACRVLVDSLGSRPFLRGGVARRLRAAGVTVRAALPVALWRLLLVRMDLRNHRKIAVIDGQVGYTGSLNLADPRYFKRSAGVGPWVDALVRIEGPGVASLAITFLQDWELESREGLEQLRNTGDVRALEEVGSAAVQLLPSGPHMQHHEIREILLNAIVLAQREVILTTPYFVPDELLLAAIASAAKRGVAVTLIVPDRVDSRLVQWASQAFLRAVAAAGGRIMLFGGGLLHTKSITIDDDFSLFGSLNLDLRSLVLNFEATLAVYDRTFNAALRELQCSYLAQSAPLAGSAPQPVARRIVENIACLVAPLL